MAEHFLITVSETAGNDAAVGLHGKVAAVAEPVPDRTHLTGARRPRRRIELQPPRPPCSPV